MSDTSDPSVNVRKKPAEAAAPGSGAVRPTTVVGLTIAMFVAGLGSILAGVMLYGHHDQLVRNLDKNSPPVTTAQATKAGTSSASSLTSGLQSSTGRTLTSAQISTREDKVSDAIDDAIPSKNINKDDLKDQQDKAKKSVSDALSKLSGPLTSEQISTVASSTEQTVTNNLTTLATKQLKDNRDTATKLPKSTTISGVVLAVALGLVAVGAYSGRYWSRWAVPVLWVLCSFTGTAAGFTQLLQLGGDAPGGYRAASAVAALALTVAVALTFVRPSRTWFEAHKPAAPEGMPARRGLFSPRVPPGSTATRPGAARGGSAARTTDDRPADEKVSTRKTAAAAVSTEKVSTQKSPDRARTKKRSVDVTAATPPARGTRPRTVSKSRRTES